MGHHASGHLEGGSIKEQEYEADRYAFKMMRQSQPILSALIRGLRWLFKRYHKSRNRRTNTPR